MSENVACTGECVAAYEDHLLYKAVLCFRVQERCTNAQGRSLACSSAARAGLKGMLQTVKRTELRESVSGV
jgi:hypothetical protein